MFDLSEMIKEMQQNIEKAEQEKGVSNDNSTNIVHIEKEKSKKEKEEEDLLKEIKDTIAIMNRTKFKKRISYSYDINTNKLEFFLDDNRFYFNSISNVLYFYNKGELAKNVKDKCFESCGIYELNEFIKQKCTIVNKPIPKCNRTSKEEFIIAYVDFVQNVLCSVNIVNLNNLNTILENNFNENIIKSGSKHWLSYITLSDKLKDIDGNVVLPRQSLINFIENYCIVSNNIKPSKRLPRSFFRKGYLAYCDKEKIKHLDSICFNEVLLKEYNENFIKSNGIWYMKKIKFKNFSE